MHRSLPAHRTKGQRVARLAVALLAGFASERVAAEPRLDDPGLERAFASFGLPTDPGGPWNADRIVVTALYFDPSVETARWTAEVAVDDAALSVERPNPTLSVTPERVLHAAIAESPWALVVALAIPLLHRPDSAARRTAARLDAQVARLELGAAFWRSRARALAALRSVLLARDAEAIAQVSEQAQSAWAAGVARRVAVGAADRGELALADAAATAARADSAARSGERAIAERQLAAAMGLPASLVAPLTLAAPELLAPPAPWVIQAADAGKLALANRLELRQLELGVRSARAAVLEAHAGRVPRADLTPSASYDRGDRLVGIGGDVELPVFHGPQATIHRAEAAAHAAEARLSQRRLEVSAEAQRAVLAYTARYAEWQSLDAAAVAARSAESQAARALAVGEVDRGVLQQASARRASVDLQALDALQRAGEALAGIEEATEHPLQASLLTDVRDRGVCGAPSAQRCRPKSAGARSEDAAPN